MWLQPGVAAVVLHRRRVSISGAVGRATRARLQRFPWSNREGGKRVSSMKKLIAKKLIALMGAALLALSLAGPASAQMRRFPSVVPPGPVWGAVYQGTWRPAGWWWQNQPQWTARNHPEWWGADYQGTWYPASWWWQNQPQWTQENHPEWWGADYQGTWYPAGWWWQNQPQWTQENHPEWWGDFFNSTWYPADWWWENQPQYTEANYPDWWGAFDGGQWYPAQWWQRTNPGWVQANHPEWAGAIYEGVWYPSGWWLQRHPAWVRAHHPEWHVARITPPPATQSLAARQQATREERLADEERSAQWEQVTTDSDGGYAVPENRPAHRAEPGDTVAGRPQIERMQHLRVRAAQPPRSHPRAIYVAQAAHNPPRPASHFEPHSAPPSHAPASQSHPGRDSQQHQ
jgi:hypothetical protein